MPNVNKIPECVAEFFDIHSPESIDKNLELAIRELIRLHDSPEDVRSMMLVLYDVKDFMKGLSRGQ